MVMDNATPRMDLQSDAEALGRPSSKVASVASSVVIAVGLGAVDDIEPCMHNGEDKGDDTSEGSKKKKEPLFLGRVKLVYLDDCNVLNRRLHCDSKDTDNDEASNREDMDVDVGAPLCVQTVGPNSSTALV